MENLSTIRVTSCCQRRCSTSLAEGRCGDDEEDKDNRKGPDVVCSLSSSDVHSEIALRTKIVLEEDENKHHRLVLQATQQAATF